MFVKLLATRLLRPCIKTQDEQLLKQLVCTKLSAVLAVTKCLDRTVGKGVLFVLFFFTHFTHFCHQC